MQREKERTRDKKERAREKKEIQIDREKERKNDHYCDLEKLFVSLKWEIRI